MPARFDVLLVAADNLAATTCTTRTVAKSVTADTALDVVSHLVRDVAAKRDGLTGSIEIWPVA